MFNCKQITEIDLTVLINSVALFDAASAAREVLKAAYAAFTSLAESQTDVAVNRMFGTKPPSMSESMRRFFF